MNPYQIFRYIPLPLLRGLARIAAWIIMCIPDSSLVRTIKVNMALTNPALTEPQKHKLTKSIVLHQCLSSVESLKSWAMPPEWSVEQICNVHNKDILLEGLASDNGMLAILPHVGTWEMMNAWLNQFGAPTIMYKPVKGKLINEFVLQGRERLSATLVPTDGSGVKAVFKTLKQGGFSIMLPDHVPEPSGGVIVPFFGVETLTSTLASKLASKTKCALVGLSCIRREDGRGFDVYCYKLNEPALYDRDATKSALALNQAMEKMINVHFDHYMWGYRRFKRVPNIGNPYRAEANVLADYVRTNNTVSTDVAESHNSDTSNTV